MAQIKKEPAPSANGTSTNEKHLAILLYPKIPKLSRPLRKSYTKNLAVLTTMNCTNGARRTTYVHIADMKMPSKVKQDALPALKN